MEGIRYLCQAGGKLCKCKGWNIGIGRRGRGGGNTGRDRHGAGVGGGQHVTENAGGEMETKGGKPRKLKSVWGASEIRASWEAHT